MQIEVDWKAKPNTGLTYIDLEDLSVKDEKEWNALDKTEQELRLNNWLKENDEPIVGKAYNWDIADTNY